MNLQAKKSFTNNFSKATAILKIVAAFPTFLSALLFFIALCSGNEMFSSISMQNGASGAAAYLILLLFMPMIVLVVMDIVWAVSFFRSFSAKSDGRILDAVSTSSLTSSLIGAFACFAGTFLSFGVAVYYDQMLKGRRYSSYNREQVDYYSLWQGIFVFLGIILILGIICLVLNSVFRKLFYSSVEKTFKDEQQACRAATPYMVMRIAGAAIKLALIVLCIILLVQIGTHSTTLKTPGTLAIVSLVFGIIALVVGIISNIFEALMVYRFSSSFAAPTDYRGYGDQYGAAYAAPYGAPVQQDHIPYVNSAEMPQEECIYCRECGAPNSASSQFCLRCGSRIYL